ncbi:MULTISPECIES: SAV_6107 family HEPN domain-containing protein [Rhodococcus]|uniref:SAV_6107 family HEPN domain-containing protein n=1 Tax=Rhodococcus oxybenzonivorans TaxID=1990687 RepID=A0AAE4UUW9_9NOCA|nr:MULTISPECIES: SAV_6107 family HEPN domain-containing protein [Rhodococcus]MDV7244177.1 SAV_6107 family HEPN domain-containing protein [Rhodococcus oxybenzonivorans]MDV7263042.1 SAV_6107 family HEPN domain-containing protein [Rhodococcus oxybenzonivorans]MDV7274581.1 SAV_6107 family HEPN domain-containing protein [Rhodococcus oxybenzonivorans]MDV7335894.1 SAV_6107 family HEPN domain-containing protein [Rhodococcus oxybenzonivorans]MDV7345531.1 SAV_6107 family HEPN domain-containing protein [
MFDSGDPAMLEGSEHRRDPGSRQDYARRGGHTGVVEVFEVMNNSVSGPTSGPSRRPGEVRAPASRRAASLLDRADALLSQSVGADSPADRFHSAYLAALRGAGAVLAAADGSPGGRRTRTRNAWVLMADAASDFGAWADYFAGHSATRAAIEAGMSRTLTDLEADEFFVEVGRFLQAVEDHIGRGADVDLRAS